MIRVRGPGFAVLSGSRWPGFVKYQILKTFIVALTIWLAMFNRCNLQTIVDFVPMMNSDSNIFRKY